MKEDKTANGEFRQQVRMAAVQVAGLRPDELAQALAYEVEPLSGIQANEAEVVYKPIIDADPTVRVYDVTVRRRTQRGGATGGLDRWLRPAVAFAILVVLAVIGDGVWMSVRQSLLARTVNERRPLQAELDRIDSQARSAHSAAEAIRSRREAAARAQEEAAARRADHADVLAALAAACGDGAALTSITSDKDARAIRVRAIDTSGESAAGMMQRLTLAIAKAGWQLVPGEIVGSGTGATVSFSFELKQAR